MHELCHICMAVCTGLLTAGAVGLPRNDFLTIDHAPHGSYLAGQVLARRTSHFDGVRRRSPYWCQWAVITYIGGVSCAALPIPLP